MRSSTFTSFEEEENEAWELGLKSQLADRVVLNAAVFYNTIKGEQLNIQEAPSTDPSLTNTVNSSNDKKVKGAEVELSWQVLDGLNMGFNFAYMDADETTDLDNPFTPAVVDLTRFYTVQVPETSGSVTLDYELDQLPMGQLAFHVDYSFADDYWTTPGRFSSTRCYRRMSGPRPMHRSWPRAFRGVISPWAAHRWKWRCGARICSMTPPSSTALMVVRSAEAFAPTVHRRGPMASRCE